MSLNMDIMKARRLSESSSSSSSDDSERSQLPCFDSPDIAGVKNGPQKRQRRDSGLGYESFDHQFKKLHSEVDLDMTEKARRMMEKMGYQLGVGLGKHGQGRLEPVEAFRQKGRRGLGHNNEKLKEANLRWDPSKEMIAVEEDILWLENGWAPPVTEELNNWIGIGPRKKSIENETLFCDPEILNGVVSSKSIFDNLDKSEMRRARTRSNPFETIRGAIFLNRAAVKMANIDKACGSIFTKPKGLRADEILYFADVCAGPGGFSEYVLWRKNWHAKGFGFTLRDSNDFKLEDFCAGGPETFHPYYGPKGDGDIYDPDNQEAFASLIMEQTGGKGVHFMMADGGFSVEGEESIQEILSKQLYLCQCLVALMTVREGGHFVTKLFDIFTPFSAGLVYIMYRCFDHVSIFKPNTSRPANSERYLICKGRRGNIEEVVVYLARVNRVLLQRDEDRDVTELVPYHVLMQDDDFASYLKYSNDELGRKQIVGLLKIAAFCEDTSLTEHRQAEIRKQCLDYWGLPDTARIIPRDVQPEERIKRLIETSTFPKFMIRQPNVLTAANVTDNIIKTANDWFCTPCGSNCYNPKDGNDKPPTFYMGMGRSGTWRYDNGSWERVRNLELPRDTLVYAKLVFEYRGESKHQMKTVALHILDAYFLGGEDISRKYILERHYLTKQFVEALWKPTVSRTRGAIHVRAKEMYSLSRNLARKLNLKRCTMKKGDQAITHTPSANSGHLDEADKSPYYVVPSSVIFLKATAQNWSRHISQSSGHSYYFNCKDNTRVYDRDRPANADAAFPETFQNRFAWDWSTDQELTIDHFFAMIQDQCSPPHAAQT